MVANLMFRAAFRCARRAERRRPHENGESTAVRRVARDAPRGLKAFFLFFPFKSFQPKNRAINKALRLSLSLFPF